MTMNLKKFVIACEIAFATCFASASPTTTTSMEVADIITRAENISAEIYRLEHAGAIHDEIRHQGTGSKARPNFDEARSLLVDAISMLQREDLVSTAPTQAARILEQDAWFQFKVDDERAKALKELTQAHEIVHDNPSIDFMLAYIEFCEFIRGKESDEVLRQRAVANVDAAISCDPKMPEAYWLRALISGTNGVPENIVADYKRYILYFDQLRPELYFFDDVEIRLQKESVLRFLANSKDTATTQGDAP